MPEPTRPAVAVVTLSLALAAAGAAAGPPTALPVDPSTGPPIGPPIGPPTLGEVRPGPPPSASPAFEVPNTPVLRGDPVAVRLTGLEPGAVVAVSAERTWGRRPASVHRSTATFRADADGNVDVRTAVPVEAPWEGADPAGFFWSMTPTDDAVPEGRSSSVVLFSVDVDGDGAPDATATVRSVRGVEGLRELPLGDDYPGAFLLLPPAEEPAPVVVVLGGSEGGDSTARGVAPKLASRGFAVLGLPYYSPDRWGRERQFPDLPRAFHDIPVDRLERVRDLLAAREDVRGDRVALYGVSKGAELALLAASRIEGFAAVVAIVPSDVVWEGWGPGTEEGACSSFAWRGEALPFVPYVGMSAEIAKYRTGETVRIRTPHDAGRAAHPDRVAPARIDVESIDEPVFLLGGGADDTWDSGGMAKSVAAARTASDLPTVTIVDEDAGHRLSGDGYTPGNAANARVQSRAFPAMIAFLSEHLRKD
ncbi:MAG: acyl-CoA thioesterase/bile acid-CoA:amino acid N-acyltransferase family protein [Planctomycetota bacterium]